MAKATRKLATPEDLLSQVVRKLEVISRVTALTLIRSVSSREEQIELLSVAGYSNKEIAELLGISYNTVGVVQFTLRKRAKKARAKLTKSSS